MVGKLDGFIDGITVGELDGSIGEILEGITVGLQDGTKEGRTEDC